MGHGKYQKPRRVPVISWVLAILMVLGLVSGGVVAYLSTSTYPVTNTFMADAPTDPEIVETWDEAVKEVKENVRVNVGDPGYAVYVRAAVVVTWKDAGGNVLAQAPVPEQDYTIVRNTDDWFEYGGFYYHKAMVYNTPDTTDAHDGTTAVLINSCTPKVSKGDYTLSVEIIAQTIQALGTTDEAVDGEGNPIPTVPAVTNAWGVEVDANKQLTAPTT